MNKFAASLRSIAAGVNLPPQIKPLAFVITKEAIIGQQLDLLATLGKCTKVTVVESEAETPKGCGIALIGESKILLELGTHIDANKELARLNKKLEEINKFKTALQVKISDKNRDKMPEKVRKEQDEQMNKFITEENALLEAIEKIKQLL